jgi:pantothenate kinase-related protein Tda10
VHFGHRFITKNASCCIPLVAGSLAGWVVVSVNQPLELIYSTLLKDLPVLVVLCALDFLAAWQWRGAGRGTSRKIRIESTPDSYN